MDTFLFSINAVLPIVLLVAFGFILKKFNFISDEFIKQANAFTFKFCFPCQMFVNVYGIDKLNKNYFHLALFASVAIIVLVLLSALYAALFVKDPKQKGVMAQAFYRSNFSFIGLPLATLLYGPAGAACAAIIIACTIPIYNISAVILLTVFIHDREHKISAKKFFKQIITNPLIIGVLAGFVFIAFRPFVGEWRLSTSGIRFIYRAIANIGQMTTTLVLIMIGGQFHFSAVGRMIRQITIGVFVRLIFAPVAGLLAARYFFPQFGGPEYAALVALFGTPVAIASALMAEQMHNDGELARQLIVWTTSFSAITLFCIIAFLRHIGIF